MKRSVGIGALLAFAFPLALVLLTALGRNMPARLYDRIMRDRIRQMPDAKS